MMAWTKSIVMKSPEEVKNEAEVWGYVIRKSELLFIAREAGLRKKSKRSVLDMLSFRTLEHQIKMLSGQLNTHLQNAKGRLGLDT